MEDSLRRDFFAVSLKTRLRVTVKRKVKFCSRLITLGGFPDAQKYLLSDVLGVMEDPSNPDSLIPSLTRASVDRYINEGVISGGMIPKVRSALDALDAGVGKVHMIDGRIPHSLLLEIFTRSGIGTEIVS